MISYELAIQLRDVGWLQTTSIGDYFYASDGNRWRKSSFDKFTDEEMTAIPTLSELIDACGDEFLGLHRADPGNEHYLHWVAGSIQKVGEVAFGKIPEEAVAKLWLRLQKNKRAD